MSSSETKKSKEPRTRDIQQQIMKMMLKRNPKCTVAQAGRSYQAMRDYLMGEVR